MSKDPFSTLKTFERVLTLFVLMPILNNLNDFCTLQKGKKMMCTQYNKNLNFTRVLAGAWVSTVAQV